MTQDSRLSIFSPGYWMPDSRSLKTSGIRYLGPGIGKSCVVGLESSALRILVSAHVRN